MRFCVLRGRDFGTVCLTVVRVDAGCVRVRICVTITKSLCSNFRSRTARMDWWSDDVRVFFYSLLLSFLCILLPSTSSQVVPFYRHRRHS